MNDLFNAVSQVGFPIVVALLLLVRVEGKMEKLGQKIDLLNDTLVAMNTLLNIRLKK